MEVKIEIKLKGFLVPNYVMVEGSAKPRQEGFTEDRKFHLSELDAITLDQLCRDFRDEIFKRAGKNQPPATRQG